MNHREYTLDELKQECVKPDPAQIDRIPTYIGRAITNSFDWSHDTPPFYADLQVRGRVKAFFDWHENREENPKFSFDGIEKAILKEVRRFQDQIDEAQEIFEGRNKADFDLRSYLGESYISVLKVFDLFASTVAAYRRSDPQEGQKHEALLKEMLPGKTLDITTLCKEIEGRFNWLIAPFRQPISELRAIGERARQSLDGGTDLTLETRLDCKLEARETKQKSDRFVYFKKDKLERTLRMMMQNSMKHGGAQNLTLRFFGEYNSVPILNNFGFSLEDDGTGFADVTSLSEKKSILQFAAEEYGNALVIVESKGKGCWYRITPAGISFIDNRIDYDKTRVTLLLPVDNSAEFVDQVLRRDLDVEGVLIKLLDSANNTYTLVKGYAKSIDKYMEILKWVEDKTDPTSQTLTAQCHQQIGNCYTHLANPDFAKIYHDKAKTKLESLKAWRRLKSKDASHLYRLYNNIAVNYMDWYDYPTSEDYCFQSLDNDSEDAATLARTKGTLGQLYTFWGGCDENGVSRYDKAEDIMQEAIEAMEQNFVDRTSDDAMPIGPEERHKLIMDAVRSRNNLAMLYIKMGKFPEAEAIFDENLRRIHDAPLPEQQDQHLTWVYYGQSNLYAYWVEQTKSEKEFQKAIHVATLGVPKPQNRGPFPYPWALTLKFKGCAYREVEQSKDGIDCLRESYEALEAANSQVLNVIAASVRLELAKLYLRRDPNGARAAARAEIKSAIGLIQSFEIESAREFFSESVSGLEEVVAQLKDGEPTNVERKIQAVLDKIPY